MKLPLIKLAAAIALSSTVAACSSSDDESNAAYIGNWSTGCTNANVSAGVDIYFIQRLEIASATWTLTTSSYVDQACTLQTSGSEAGGDLSERSTITVVATYTDEGTVMTPSGLDANKLSSTVTSITNTLNPDEDSDEQGETADVLVFVSDTNVLYLDSGLVANNFSETETGISVSLTLPFNRSE